LYTTDSELEALFKSIDVDGSGEIDFKELKRHVTSSGRGGGGGGSGGGGDSSPSKRDRENAIKGTWSRSSGRDLSTNLLSGIEPPERRSLGPATYDPRRGSAFTRANLGLGGAKTSGKRDVTRIVTGPEFGPVGFIYRGVDDSLAPPRAHHAPSPPPTAAADTAALTPNANASPVNGTGSTAAGAPGGAAAGDTGDATPLSARKVARNPHVFGGPVQLPPWNGPAGGRVRQL
jgi:hypothetical protein